MKFTMTTAAMLVGLTSLSPVHAQSVELRVDATPSIFTEMFQELVSTFEAKNPDIRITIDTSQRDQADAIQRTLRQAVINELPDVSFQGFNYLRQLSDAGYVVPLDGLIAADPDWTNASYSPSVATSGKVGDHVFGLGVAFSFPIIYYNADLVSEAQHGEQVLPGDWDSILKLAENIHERHPDILGAYTRYNAFLFQGHVMSGGGSLGDAEGTKVTFDDAKGMEAFRRLQRFGEIGQAKIDMTDAQVRQSFAGGKIAIHVDSSSSLENFQKQVGERFDIATARFPLAEPGGALPTSGVAVVLHSTDPERQKASWRFMRFVAGPEGQSIVGRKTGYVPANEIAVTTPALLGDYYKTKPEMAAALSSIRYAAPWYEFNGPNTARINKLFVDHLQQVVTLQQTPDVSAAALSEAVSALIRK